MIPDDALAYVKQLRLEKQALGNYFVSTYESVPSVTALPDQKRKFASGIYNLYACDIAAKPSGAQGGFPLHTLKSEEVWHYYDGDGPILIYEFDLETGKCQEVVLGLAKRHGSTCAVPQYVVRGSTIQGALLADGTSWCLTGASNVPAFVPGDSQMIVDDNELLHKLEDRFPEKKELINRLTVAFL